MRAHCSFIRTSKYTHCTSIASLTVTSLQFLSDDDAWSHNLLTDAERHNLIIANYREQNFTCNWPFVVLLFVIGSIFIVRY
jgi:hypothetical protein